MIYLPYGGMFDEHDLIEYIVRSGRDYIIQGQQNSSMENHSKRLSLDYWLRTYAPNPNTKQAVTSVISSLERTGLFRMDNLLICPETGRRCRGIVLLSSL